MSSPSSPPPSRTPPTAVANEVDDAEPENWAVGGRPVRDVHPVCPFVRRRQPAYRPKRGTRMSHPDPGPTRREQRETPIDKPTIVIPAPRRLTVLLTAGAYLLITLDALVVVTALPS